MTWSPYRWSPCPVRGTINARPSTNRDLQAFLAYAARERGLDASLKAAHKYGRPAEHTHSTEALRALDRKMLLRDRRREETAEVVKRYACAWCRKDATKLYDRDLCISCTGEEYDRAYREGDERAREAFQAADYPVHTTSKIFVSDLLGK